ncbi:hypothetical protein SH580_05840 [Coraliomargarita algicola]|uniref:Uncharacterized protein n=1 Tax=Coraliomargarita algicola TaxID=3092156 RepID=A0ABZ0RNX7_9BACT|nr:hypothetical protein [Coraliomargarita sp. J2-16]WPJ97227.1 hypothetical protein SH580_05840 [Coraliomargarita sp. J2-16]
MDSISKIRDELKSKYPKRYKAAKALLFLYVFVFVISGLYWSILFPMGIAGYKAEEFGQWGDAFGFWNSLFSGAALILVVISVYLQNKEISEIGESIKHDGFEKTFFSVLDIIAQSRQYVLPFKQFGQHHDGDQPMKSVSHALFAGKKGPLRKIGTSQSLNALVKTKQLSMEKLQKSRTHSSQRMTIWSKA